MELDRKQRTGKAEAWPSDCLGSAGLEQWGCEPGMVGICAGEHGEKSVA